MTGTDRITRARLKDDGTVVEVMPDGSERPLAPKVDWAKIDATTEDEIARQIAEDEADAMRDIGMPSHVLPGPAR
jgi:hypothetical protein